jgi:DtxR family transcriptional regulator, Mn-dependent transcriptional regulator
MPDSLIALIISLVLITVTALVFWPDRGLVSRLRHLRRMSRHVRTEDALKHLYKLEARHESPSLHSVAGALEISTGQAAALLAEMEKSELVKFTGGQLCLTPAGAEAALHVIRAHRLWEQYLAEETGYEQEEWHDRAELREHILTPEEVNALSAQLGYPTHDPHGDPIPTPLGQLQPHGGKPLPAFQPNGSLRIVHIEDEPDVVYAQIMAEGLYPGMFIRLLEITTQRVRFWANGNEHLLAPIVAANISVVAVVEEPAQLESEQTLDSLPLGETAEVLRLSGQTRGPERRRLMDMGILPGTQILVELNGPVGDPRGYRVRGTLIALRQEQARRIFIRPIEGESL